MNDTNPAPDPAPSTSSRSTTSSKADDDAKRYAVYDLTYEKFVGPVTDKKPSKAAAEKAAGHDNVELREV